MLRAYYQALIVTAFCCLAQSSLAEGVGFISSLDGEVLIRPAQATAFSSAQLDREVFIGDVIRTESESFVKVLLADDTTLTIDEKTELVVNRYFLGNQVPTEQSILRQIGGALRVLVGESFGGPNRVELHTPTAVIGVKGTEYFSLVVRGANQVITYACTLHGEIIVENVDRSLGEAVSVVANMCSQIPEHAAPSTPFPAPAWLLDQAEALSKQADMRQEADLQLVLELSDSEKDWLAADLLLTPPAVGIAATDADPLQLAEENGHRLADTFEPGSVPGSLVEADFGPSLGLTADAIGKPPGDRDIPVNVDGDGTIGPNPDGPGVIVPNPDNGIPPAR